MTDAPRPTAARMRWTPLARRGVVRPAMLLRLSASAPENRRRRMLAASLAVHLLLIGLLLLWVRQEAPPEPLPPPAVAMIFESGNRAGPSAPEPTPEAAIPAPPEAPAAPPAPEAPAAPAAPTTAEALPVPPPMPQPPAVADVPPPPPPHPQAETSAPVPLAPVPPPPVPPAPVSPPQKMAALPMPPLPRPPLPMPPRTQPAPRPPGSFPAPMNYSLGPTRPSFSTPHQNASTNEAVGPVTRGAAALGRFAEVTKGKVDADWLNDLHRWWLQHGYYPEQAAMAGEDGTVGIQIVVDRYGRVRFVDLQSRSGSPWLDMGAQAVFRGANLPPFPPGTHDDEVTLDLHINYILVRR